MYNVISDNSFRSLSLFLALALCLSHTHALRALSSSDAPMSAQTRAHARLRF